MGSYVAYNVDHPFDESKSNKTGQGGISIRGAGEVAPHFLEHTDNFDHSPAF